MALAFSSLLVIVAHLQGCAAGGTTVGLVTQPPPPAISITVTPGSALVLLGNSQAFTATQSNASNTNISWSVDGILGGSATLGTISTAGLYTAPPDLPSPAVVQVTATSQNDPTKSATAIITISSDLSLSIAPNPASVELGATQSFRAAITSAGHPDTAMRWSLAGASCPFACGSVDENGTYSAPQLLPSFPNVTLTASSIADPSKQASASLTITSTFTLQVSGPVSVSAGASGALTATIVPALGSNPSAVVDWALAGTGCTGTSCGVLNALSPSITTSNVTSATYTAPPVIPNPNTVTVTVTSQADPSKKAQLTLTILPGITVGLSPATASLAAYHRVTLAAQVFGASNSAVLWTVNGISNGNGTFGQICAVGTGPCQPPPGGNSLVDYQAPGAIPNPNPVTVQAISVADPTKSAATHITILNHVVVTIMPANVTLTPLATQGFTATVLGTTNQAVVWQLRGTACATSGACGSIDANGTYLAPAAAPSPDNVQVVAISADDTAQSGAANVIISTGPSILSLHPASVYAGGADGFTLRVDGSNFVPTGAGPGSLLLVAGTLRTTTCASVVACIAPVTPVDVALTGSISVQIQNPNGSASNVVSLVVVPSNSFDEVIPLINAAPAAIGKDIVVVEPTTAGVSVPGNDVDLNVAALGTFSTANNSCAVAGNPVALQRPSSGIATADICVFSASGLDTSMSYSLSGSGDVAVISKQSAGLGIIHLTLQVPATAFPGARTLFIQNPNLDKAAATAALEVY